MISKKDVILLKCESSHLFFREKRMGMCYFILAEGQEAGAVLLIPGGEQGAGLKRELSA